MMAGVRVSALRKINLNSKHRSEAKILSSKSLTAAQHAAATLQQHCLGGRSS
jgi:hypothetical protein